MSKRKAQGAQPDNDMRPISDEMVATSEESETSTASESSIRRKSHKTGSSSPQRKDFSRRHETQHAHHDRRSNLDTSATQSTPSIQNTAKTPRGYAPEQFSKSSSHAINTAVSRSDSQAQRNKQTWLIQAPRGLSFTSTPTLLASRPDGERFKLAIDGVEYTLSVQKDPHQTTPAILLDGREGMDPAVALATIGTKAVLKKSMRQNFINDHTEVIDERASAHKQPQGLRVRYVPFGVRA